MTHPNASTALARVVVDELACQGVEVMVIAPGSRSGALAIAAAQHPDIETRVVIDERSAAFHALGVARASRVPAAVLSTSGTAPANFFPAIVEADMSFVPLVVISADRPAEMQGVGANQTVDQVEMFGTRTRAYAGIEAPSAGEDSNVLWRGVVTRLVASANGGSPGPVHLNVRFREPTVPVSDDGRVSAEPYGFATPRVRSLPMETGDEAHEDMPVLEADRGLLIAGDGAYDRERLLGRAAELGWPILATALSGMRGRGVVSTYHHLLAKGVPAALQPETVVAVGAIGPSSRLETLIATAPTRVRIDRWGRRVDPERNATHVLHGDVGELLEQARPVSNEWALSWSEADQRARSRLREILSETRAMSGPAVVVAVDDLDWAALAVASSLPIRDVDAHLDHPGPVFANRGASGIDGFVSTALGVASRIPQTLALAGDLSLLHDSNGFIVDAAIDVTIVVVDNEGGGLFDSLPQARHAPEYERLFVTRPNRSFRDLARFHGLRYEEAGDMAGLARAVGESLHRPGIDLIRVSVDREHDLAVRAQMEG